MDGINPNNNEYKSENTVPLVQTNGSLRSSSIKKPSLTDEDLRNACYEYIKDFYCYGSRFIRDMVLTDIQNECAFHYTLESFGEKREYAERTTSYFGQRIDGPHNGPAPGLWEIEIKPTALFKDHQETAEIPHTAYVQHCEACKWNMKVRCDTCSGKGEHHCLSCLGNGKEEGGNKCAACKGSGKEMKTCTEDFISNTSNLPKGLILEAEGEQIYKEEGKMVHPIDLDLDKEVNEASTTLITKHYASSVDEEIIAQRHFLRTVPLTKATYTWRNKEGEFYVYGLERKVYFEDYPQTCGNCICC
ncbi:protein SSUH2 homolog isoform X2 [Argiope bruennichi]|uniref:protein SSUH2 homolog isoform X2 n=1 Tax=Argiope bruennichi TaxID=94029 RepID=UPI002493DB11|nr:protein SSUH2 homolog isoform X2 [Argiope bruennichi]